MYLALAKMIVKRKNKILFKDCKACITSWSKAIGLMFSKQKAEFCLIFNFDKLHKVDLHMFFVTYPIDVVFLDNRYKVVELKENFKPWHFYSSNKEIQYFLEVPCGTIKKKNIGLGELLEIEKSI